MNSAEPRWLLELHRVRALHRFAYGVRELCYWVVFLLLLLALVLTIVSKILPPGVVFAWIIVSAPSMLFVLSCMISVLGQVNALIRRLESSND